MTPLLEVAPLFQRLPFGWSLLFMFTVVTAIGVMLFYTERISKAFLSEQLVGRVSLGFRLVISAWLAVAYLLAEQGNLNTASGLLAIFIGTVVFLLIPFAWSKVRIGALMLPISAPILVHMLRVLQEISLWQYAAAKEIPAEITLMGANLDVHIGATALFVSVAIYSGAKFGRTAAIVWNLLGITILAATVANGFSYASQAGGSNVFAAFPLVWLPGFLWPFWLLTHLVSLWQLLAPQQLQSEANQLREKLVAKKAKLTKSNAKR